MSPEPGPISLWEVSARGSGEVLTAEQRAPGLVLTLLGVPAGFSEPEVRGWLHDVAGVALDAARGEQPAQPIPALLHHALTGLLFSHAEVWDRPDQAHPCSAVFTSGNDEIGFGWVGEAEVEVRMDDAPVDVRYVVRDESGRQAMAWSAPRDRMVRVRLVWCANREDPAAPMVVLHAGWDGTSIEPGLSIEEMLSSSPSAPPATERHADAEAALAAAESALPPWAITAPGLTEANATAWSNERAPEPEPWNPEHAAPSAPVPVDATESRAIAPSADWSADASAISHEAIAIPADDPAPAQDLDPARPSSGIARWLQRNFSWLASRQAPLPPALEPEMHAMHAPMGGAAPMGAMPHAVPATPPMLERALASDANAYGGAEYGASNASSGEPPPPRAVAPAYETPVPAAEPPPPLMPELSFEDRLAADAAALAAALGGDPITTRPEPPRLTRPSDALAGAGAGDDPSMAWRSLGTAPPADAVFGRLPQQIPPTPEPPALSAQAAPLSVPAPAGPPRIEITPKSFLRKPGERAPGAPGAHDAPEIHSRALDPGALPAAAPAEPLRIERIGNDAFPQGSTVANQPVGEVAPASGVVPPLPASLAPSVGVTRLEQPLPMPTPPPQANEPRGLDLVSSIQDAVSAPRYVAPPPAPVEESPPPELELAPALSQAQPASGRRAESVAEAEAWDRPAADPTAQVDARGARTRRMSPQHPAWPASVDLESEPRSFDVRWGWIAAVVLVLFAGGWLLGSFQWGSARPGEKSHGVVAAMMRSLGFHGPTFSVDVASRPDGAHILVDGTDTGQRTPAVVPLPPGKHIVALSFGQWGQIEYPLHGKQGDKLTVDGTLWGSMEIISPEANAVIAVAVDGRPRGFAPLRVDSLAPGPHQVRFSGPGMASWGQTVEVDVNEAKQVLTRPLSSPSTGVLQVRITATQDGEAVSLRGGRVFIDGEPRGAAPVTVELARGPHSVRVEYGNDLPPIQVIDLPGGNQRFASFGVGGSEEYPRIKLDVPARFTPGGTAVVSATLGEVPPAELREMWLHVRGSDGNWRRYEMTALPARLAAVGAVAFPLAQFDDRGKALWYVSAVTAQGDEYFTDMQTATLDRSKGR